jgi:putative glycerol-1-phosphate prenyltransferase
MCSATANGQKRIAQLIDPDKIRSRQQLYKVAQAGREAGLDYFFFGGSLITQPREFDLVEELKRMCSIPVVLFPSGPAQLNAHADAVLFLSLISGRNAEYLIGHHVVAAPIIAAMDLECIPTGYMLVDTGATNTAIYMSHTAPLPYHKGDVAAATALAGQLLGLKLLYLDAGSGARTTVHPAMVEAVRRATTLPLVVGGGIRNAKQARALMDAGADILVCGTAAEENPHIIAQLCAEKCL